MPTERLCQGGGCEVGVGRGRSFRRADEELCGAEFGSLNFPYPQSFSSHERLFQLAGGYALEQAQVGSDLFKARARACVGRNQRQADKLPTFAH